MKERRGEMTVQEHVEVAGGLRKLERRLDFIGERIRGNLPIKSKASAVMSILMSQMVNLRSICGINLDDDHLRYVQSFIYGDEHSMRCPYCQGDPRVCMIGNECLIEGVMLS